MALVTTKTPKWERVVALMILFELKRAIQKCKKVKKGLGREFGFARSGKCLRR